MKAPQSALGPKKPQPLVPTTPVNAPTMARPELFIRDEKPRTAKKYFSPPFLTVNPTGSFHTGSRFVSRNQFHTNIHLGGNAAGHEHPALIYSPYF
jgi:hypothetical protein